VGSRDDRLLCIAFSPDSKTIAAGGYMNLVRLFDVSTQTEVARIETTQAWSLVFRDDFTLIIGTMGSWEAWQFDRSRNALTLVQQPSDGRGKVRGVFPVGEDLLVTGSEAEPSVAVWDARWLSSNQELTFQWPEGIMPTRRLVLNANLAAELLLVQRLGGGSQVAQMKYFSSIFPVASPTEDLLAVAETRTDVRIWNTTTWQPVRLVKSPENRDIHQIHFSADRRWLAAGCGQGVAGAWNLESGEWRQLLQTDSQERCLVQCSPGRNLVACAILGSDVVELWDLDQTRRLERLVLDSSVQTLCFSPDGRLLAVGEAGLGISLWETETGLKIDTLTGHTRAITRLAFSPDGRTC
jgi:WD40 repeat protein